MTPYRLGIDLGGSKIEAVILNEQGDIVFQQRVKTPVEYDDILLAIKGVLEQAEAEVAATLRVGIATPGALSPRTGLLRNSNTLCMNDKNLLLDLQRTLDRPVRIANDANCFALSEAMDGAAAEYEMVFGVIIGTGTGGGIVWRKQLMTGQHAITGEWGHNPLPWPQPCDKLRPCYCGKVGCIETFLSGPGMAANARALDGLHIDSQDIAHRAEQGDAVCMQQMQHYYDQMARALAHVINVIDPDAIVLGGGMSNIKGIYKEVPKRLDGYVFSDFVQTPLLPPKYGDASGVRGAAWLWW